MRKRSLTIFLALALCAGLAVPAFAAGNTPEFSVTVSGPGSGIPEADREFTLRNFTEEFIASSRYVEVHTVFTRNEGTELVNANDVSILTPGSTVTVDGLSVRNPSAETWDTVSLYAWSDPDGDGVYDQRLFTYIWSYSWVENNVAAVPLSELGPFTYYEFYYSEGLPIYSLAANVCGYDALTSCWYGEFPSSVTLSAEFLTELFGPNTLVQLRVGTPGTVPDHSPAVLEEPSFYYYLPEKLDVPPAFPDAPESAPSDVPEFSFTDVPEGAYYTQPVRWAVENGVTDGTTDTTFSPGQDCTQAQILTFLWRAENQPASAAKAPVSVAAAYAGAVSWAYEMGMIDDSFDPNAPCTRADAMIYIWQAFGGPPGKGGSFTDVPADADCAGAVAWAVESGITNGIAGTTFGTGQVCSRGEIVTFLYRAYVPSARLTVS